MAASPSDDAVPNGAPSTSSVIDFLYLCQSLKSEIGLYHFDRNKCIKLAIVHDIAEAIVGDITPIDGVSKKEKTYLEKTALDHMCKVLGGGSAATEITKLWMEYESNFSLEAKFVKDLDKVEMILQALEYEDEQGKNLKEFFRSIAGKFQTETGKAWASEIVSRRKNPFPITDRPDNM